MGNQKDVNGCRSQAGLMMEEELGETDELQNRRKNGYLNAKAEQLQDVELDNSIAILSCSKCLKIWQLS